MSDPETQQQSYLTLESFLDAAKRDEVFPKFYFDTNVIVDIIEYRSQSSIDLFNFLVARHEWGLYTAVFAEVEIHEKKQKDEFRRQKEEQNWCNERILRNIDKRDLSIETLRSVSQQVDAEIAHISAHLEDITCLDDYGWDRAIEIKSSTNIPDHDSIHLAEALAVPCDILLSRDAFFTHIAEAYIWARKPEEIIDILGIACV